ncbi:MAG: polysaccharide biosynthesis/export family protein, partial [Flavobacteriales bacterium]
ELISFDIYTADGTALLEATTGGGASINGRSILIDYLVDPNGNVELPVIGLHNILGLTVKEAQDFLEVKYNEHFNKSFAVLRILNRRAIMFTAPAGTGQVIELVNPGTNVIEALAIAGGIGQNADASEIMLIRKIGNERKIYMIDLSTIDGIRYANMAVESNDIIYVKSITRYGAAIRNDVQPWVFLLTSITATLSVLSTYIFR